MPDEKTTVLVVGTGSIGQRHAQLLAERQDIELWICDTDEACIQETLQAVPEARVFRDFDTALQEGPQAVFVCTPHHLHQPMATAAFEAGCDVFCEKPLAGTVADGETIVAAAENSGKTLQVGYAARFHPVIKKIQEILVAGELGTLVAGRALVGAYYTLEAARNRYRVPVENALVLDYTHQPDYLSLFFGQAEQVSAEAVTRGNLELIQEPNVFSMVLRYESGALVQVHLDYVQYPTRHILELFGDRATLVFNFFTNELQTFTHGQTGCHVEHVMVNGDDMMRDQMNSFLEAMRSGSTPVCTGADGVAVLRIAEAAVRAARELRAVEI